jgi:hypothetical protein
MAKTRCKAHRKVRRYLSSFLSPLVIKDRMSSPSLHEFSQGELQERVFPGIDAAVVFVAEGQKPSTEVEAALRKARENRWYPVEGGYLAKAPWSRVAGSEILFRCEPKGWDHVHCDFCGTSIAIGVTCWISPATPSAFIFCAACRSQVKPA